MANEQHVAIIRQGADAIAAWREANPDVQLDLRGANLRRARLEHGNLNGVDLRRVNLEWADLRWADLIKANLSGADLRRADLHKADLQEASLWGADLQLANLEDANLNEADLTGATFGHTRLLNTDLRRVYGVVSISHEAPSTIDEETLKKAGKLPRVFLEGCGLDQETIDQYAE